MTSTEQTVARGGAGAPPRHGLARLVADRTVLAEKHWGRMPLLTRADELPSPADLFDSAAVDELLSVRGLRTPFLRMAKQGRTLPDSAFTLGGGVGAAVGDQVSEDKVLRHFADGASIVLQGLHRTWEPVIALAQDTAADLGHPVQVNAYITPPSSRGFDVHFDVHDVFVVQVEGRKHWELREPVHANPLRDEPHTAYQQLVDAAKAQPPWLEATLEPGDCLYLPRGWLHSAIALGETSIHLTLGVHVWTAHRVVQAAVARALRDLTDADLRAALPLGADPSDPDAVDDVLREWGPRLSAALTELDAPAVAEQLSGEVRAAERAEPLAPLHQLGAVDDERTEWVVRGGLAASWRGDSLVTRAGRLDLDPPDVVSVRALLDGAPATGLEPSLRRRLVLAGVLLPRVPSRPSRGSR